MHDEGVGDVAGEPFLVGEAVPDGIHQARNATKAMQTTAGDVGDMRNATKGHEMVRTDAMDGDAADDDEVAAGVLDPRAKYFSNVLPRPSQETTLPEVADPLGGRAHVAVTHLGGVDATGAQQSDDGGFERLPVESPGGLDADGARARSEVRSGRVRVVVVVSHGC
jgi:hypothetical protein